MYLRLKRKLTKLAASDDYHKTALDCGLVQFHCQGYKDGWYQETCEALNTAVKSMDADSDEEAGNATLTFFTDEVAKKHAEYDWYVLSIIAVRSMRSMR